MVLPIRILLIGKNGQVGWELQRTLASLGDVIAMDRTGIDLSNPDSIRAIVRQVKPNLIVNAAAYTAVDKAESECELAMAVNGIAPGVIAEEAKRINAAVIHYSTDYVFDGTKNGSYVETDIPNPLSIYGKTKLAGEAAITSIDVPHFIFRTSWVYGLRGKNFLLTVQRLAKEREELKIVNDQIGAPTWSRLIAEATALVVARMPIQFLEMPSGIYHLTASDATSWFDFANAIVQKNLERTILKVLPITTAEYPTSAHRPANSTLSTQKFTDTFRLTLPSWQHCLDLCLDEGNLQSF